MEIAVENKHNSKLIAKIRTYIVRLSIQWKIALAMLITFIIILPSVSLSLFYFTNLLSSFSFITDQDVRLGRMATELSVTMLDIRRYERNYRMFGSQSERVSVENLIAHAESILIDANIISPVSDKPLINELSGILEIYSNSFSMLVEHLSQNPPETDIQQKARLSKRLNDFQTAYRNILNTLNKANPAERDSILATASESIDIFSLDLLASSNQQGQPSYIQENLDRSRQAFLNNAHELAERSWSNMLSHKQDSLRIEARAKRNIISVLILTGIVCVFMIIYLPLYIVRPITLLNRIFRKAQEGDFKAYAPVLSKDEIGELAKSYNLMMERLSMYDNLKTQKIASQKRAFDRFLENLEVPACIVTQDTIAIYYNAPFAAIFGSSVSTKPPEGGLDIKQVKEMNDLAEKLQKKIAETASNFSLDIIDQNGMPVKMKGRLVRNPLMSLESVVLVGVSGKNGESEH